MKKVSDEITTEQLIADFKTMVADAEALLKATANHGGEELAGVRAKAEESIKTVKARIADEQAALLVRTKEAVKATDVYVHENPWTAVGVAAGVGLVVGLLSNRQH
jgi:ElaB/YqjD/DUF883 family membrane-anchored ribosome-binding protein